MVPEEPVRDRHRLPTDDQLRIPVVEDNGIRYPDDLAIQIEDGDAEEAWKAVSEWWSLEENLDIARAALALYDFDPDTEGDRPVAEGAGADRGSFASSIADEPGLSRTA